MSEITCATCGRSRSISTALPPGDAGYTVRCDRCSGLPVWYRRMWSEGWSDAVIESVAVGLIGLVVVLVLVIPPPGERDLLARVPDLELGVAASEWIGFLGIVAAMVLALALLVESGHRELGTLSDVWVVDDVVVDRVALRRVTRIARRTQAFAMVLTMSGLFAAAGALASLTTAIARADLSLMLPALGGVLVYAAARAMRVRVNDASGVEEDVVRLRAYVDWKRDGERADRSRSRAGRRSAAGACAELHLWLNLLALPPLAAIPLGVPGWAIAWLAAGSVLLAAGTAASFVFVAAGPGGRFTRAAACLIVWLICGAGWLLLVGVVVEALAGAVLAAGVAFGGAELVAIVATATLWRRGGSVPALISRQIDRGVGDTQRRYRLPDSLYIYEAESAV